MSVVPTTIDIPQSEIDHYREILQTVRLPDEPLISGSEEDPSYGTTLAQLKRAREQLLALDWRVAEKEMNQCHHFFAEVENTRIHFIHEKSAHAHAIPLLLLHGWPFSFWEFKRLIHPLLNPPEGQQAFDLVIPSLPGVFLSSVIPDKNHGVEDVARVLNTLMVDVLGYKTYGAHGGDFGAVNMRALQLNHSENCKLLHYVAFPAPQPADFAPDTDAQKLPAYEQMLLVIMARFKQGSAYLAIQRGDIGSLAYAMYDGFSMVSWLISKYHAIFEMARPVKEERESIWNDIILTILMYQYTHSSHTSMLMYKQSTNGKKGLLELFGPVDDDLPRSPMGVSLFSGEFLSAPKTWIERCGTLVFHKYHAEGGGHIATSSQPKLLVEDIRNLFSGHWIAATR